MSIFYQSSVILLRTDARHNYYTMVAHNDWKKNELQENISKTCNILYKFLSWTLIIFYKDMFIQCFALSSAKQVLFYYDIDTSTSISTAQHKLKHLVMRRMYNCRILGSIPQRHSKIRWRAHVYSSALWHQHKNKKKKIVVLVPVLISLVCSAIILPYVSASMNPKLRYTLLLFVD